MKHIHQLFFTQTLLEWNNFSNNRIMPWKGERDPYKIWISEIMLQQTRVEQGLGYFNRFVHAFPTIHDLAAADDTNVFKLWEGLGYYSRCRNLLETARLVVSKYNGDFPTTYNEIVELKGIGPYTAAAIASFAYSLPYAVVDGNVLRVLSRFFGLAQPIDDVAGRKMYNQLADSLLATDQPAAYNQAIMDFGATICKPKIPLCYNCPLQSNCTAYINQLVEKLPIKSKRLLKKNRYFHYIIFRQKQTIYCKKRIEKDIWQNLYEFYLIESNKILSIDEILHTSEVKRILSDIPHTITTVSVISKQQLTHQLISGIFVEIKLEETIALTEDFIVVEEKNLFQLPMPKFILSYLSTKKDQEINS